MPKKKVGFFNKPSNHSIVKSDIVSEYFGAWLDIMKKHCRKLTYLDLFSGPGFYDDGTPSTPIKVFDIIELKDAHENLKTHFFEKDDALRAKLKDALEQHDVYNRLVSTPEISPREISSKIVGELPINDCTLSFVDPHGYDLSAGLLVALIRNWGSDCIFYLTTSGIRRNIENATEEENLVEIFGESRLEDLKTKFKIEENWLERDKLILEELENKLLDDKGKPLYFLPFGMQFENKRLISYYLVLITKHHLGFKMMKDIMSKEERCVLDADGIPLYYYSRIERERGTQLELQLEKKFDRMGMLKARLQSDFKCKTIKVKDIVDACHKSGYFETTSNMIDAMLRLELESKLKVDTPREKRMRKGKPTLGEERFVTYLP